MKKNKLIKDFKLYNLIMSNIWQLLVTILFGFLLGYLLNRNAENKDNHYMLFSIILFIVIGIINFFIAIVRGLKKLEKSEKQKQEWLKQQQEEAEIGDENSD